jgi:hypothetical protein
MPLALLRQQQVQGDLRRQERALGAGVPQGCVGIIQLRPRP